MKKIFLLMFAALFACPAFAADSKPVSYKSGDETVRGALYTPAGKGPFPAIIVIHEWWGLNDWVKEQASKLADQGYEALAIDLYRGKVATTPDMAHELMRGVPEDRAKRDLHIESMAHLTCVGSTREMLQTVLDEAAHLGIENWPHFAIASSSPRLENRTIPCASRGPGADSKIILTCRSGSSHGPRPTCWRNCRRISPTPFWKRWSRRSGKRWRSCWSSTRSRLPAA